MSLQTDISVDELFDVFLGESAEDGDGCETTQPSCDREAVFAIRWRADGRVDVQDRCSCARLTHQCLAHGEVYMGIDSKDLLVQCARCKGFMVPIHVDRIRRTT